MLIERMYMMLSCEFDREAFSDQLAAELRVLRASAKVSQEDVAHAMDVSRQTYCSYENKTRKIPWSMCLALLFYFRNIPEANALIEAVHLVPDGPVRIEHYHIRNKPFLRDIEVVEDNRLSNERKGY